MIAFVLVAGGLLGLAFSLVLTIEKIALLKDSAYVPTCSINPVLSCGSIMRTPQAELLGFPNPLLGVAGFSVVVTVGVVVLAGVALPRWFWLGLQAGATAGVVFVHWLIYQSLVVIGALCPYCMVVWAVTIPVFWYVTLHNFRLGWLQRYHGVVLTVWYLGIAAAVLASFWDYWTSAQAVPQ